MTDRRFTAPHEAMSALRTSMQAHPRTRDQEQTYRCPSCRDSGWEEVDSEDRGTVRRCHRGCEPPVKGDKRVPAPDRKKSFA